jgi:hypothetical protein
MPVYVGIILKINMMKNSNKLKQNDMKIISIRENPEYRDRAIDYISSKWLLVSKAILPILYLKN